MTKAECSRCINDKFYLDADTDDAECVECGRKFPADSRLREQVVISIDRIRKEAESKFLMHQDDF